MRAVEVGDLFRLELWEDPLDSRWGLLCVDVCACLCVCVRVCVGKGVQSRETGDEELAAIQSWPGFGGMGGVRDRWIPRVWEGLEQDLLGDWVWVVSGG